MSTALRFILIALFNLILLLQSREVLAQESTLQSYIAEGLSRNLVLKEKNIGLEKALLSLKSAAALFMPGVSLQGSYTTGEGGRNISLPVGDLLNPVYATLNEMSGSNAFPQIENVKQSFFPDNLYDVKVRTSLPLLNTDLVYNRQLQAQQVRMQELELDRYRRELVKDIKTAYYQYISAVRSVSIYEEALSTAREGSRVNQSLLANGKGLPAYLLRSEAEEQAILSRLEAAGQQRNQAQRWFNFLLNREPLAAIDTTYSGAEGLEEVPRRLQQGPLIGQREELLQLRQQQHMQTTALKLNRGYVYPKLSAFVDLGLQAEKGKLGREDADYYLAGVQLEVPLFAGFSHRYKIRQSKLDLDQTALRLSDTENQLVMSAAISRNQLSIAWSQYQSAKKQETAAHAYHRLIDKGYREGVNTFLEILDARNQLTIAQVQRSVSELQVLSALAQLEREEAADPVHGAERNPQQRP